MRVAVSCSTTPRGWVSCERMAALFCVCVCVCVCVRAYIKNKQHYDGKSETNVACQRSLDCSSSHNGACRRAGGGAGHVRWDNHIRVSIIYIVLDSAEARTAKNAAPKPRRDPGLFAFTFFFFLFGCWVWFVAHARREQQKRQAYLLCHTHTRIRFVVVVVVVF